MSAPRGDVDCCYVSFSLTYPVAAASVTFAVMRKMRKMPGGLICCVGSNVHSSMSSVVSTQMCSVVNTHVFMSCSFKHASDISTGDHL